MFSFQGLVLDHICTSAPQCKKQRFIYLGDGRGDFCPTLKLRNNDYVMPRKNYPLWDRICSNQMLLKAEVIAWSNAEELQKFLLHLINTISDEENLGSKKTSCSNSSGCQSHTMPVYSWSISWNSVFLGRVGTQDNWMLSVAEMYFVYKIFSNCLVLDCLLLCSSLLFDLNHTYWWS